jgi:hypothetical protein
MGLEIVMDPRFPFWAIGFGTSFKSSSALDRDPIQSLYEFSELVIDDEVKKKQY